MFPSVTREASVSKVMKCQKDCFCAAFFNLQTKIPIRYHPYKRDEAMHGVGLRQKKGLQLCGEAVRMREKQRMVLNNILHR
jgi:hypothetical protein